MSKRVFSKLDLILIPDFLISIYMIAIIFIRNNIPDNVFYYSIAFIGVYILFKALIMIFTHKSFSEKIEFIRNTIEEFKKGKFSISKKKINNSTLYFLNQLNYDNLMKWLKN